MAINRSEVRALLKRFSLLHHQQLVMGALEPAVRLIRGPIRKRPLPLGRSKFGGEPHLHDPSHWPVHEDRPLHFLAQIRLSDLPKRHIPDMFLPSRGWLWFWHDRLADWLVNNTRTNVVDYLDGFKVTFSPDEAAPLIRCPYPEFVGPPVPKKKRLRFYQPPKFKSGPEAAMRLDPVASLHHLAITKLLNALEIEDGKTGWERGYSFYQALHRLRRAAEIPGRWDPAWDHQLMGDIHESMTGDSGSYMRIDCVRFEEARQAGRGRWEKLPGAWKDISLSKQKPWRLLAKFSSDEEGLDWCWSDVGELCFWMHEADLAAREFTNAQGHVESS